MHSHSAPRLCAVTEAQQKRIPVLCIRYLIASPFPFPRPLMPQVDDLINQLQQQTAYYSNPSTNPPLPLAARELEIQS